MEDIAIFCFWGLVGFTALNSVLVLITTGHMLARRRQPPVRNDELPKAAVLLSLRGADPSLSLCLRRLLAQDYPNYELFVAVDSDTDPSYQIVQDTLRETGATNVRVRALRNHLSTCGLKCSALVQLVDDLDDSHKVIALADADLVSHSTWLRELVVPLLDPQVGVTFGNRWFMPAEGWIGSLVRQLWNAPGLVFMHLFSIPWAGSMAIRSDVFYRGRIRDKWARSIVDDGPVHVAVKAQKLKLRFVSSLIMVNREECNLSFAYNFFRRQMTWTRTYITRCWFTMFAYIFSVMGLLAFSGALLAVNYFTGAGGEAARSHLTSGLTISSVAGVALWLILDGVARLKIRRQGEDAPSSYLRQLAYMPVVLSLAGLIHASASVMATFRRRVVWRGVTYEINGPSDIRVLSDSGLGAIPRVSTAVSI